MSERIQESGLQVAAQLHQLLTDNILPGTGLDAGAFWAGLADILADLTPRNRELLAIREAMQAKMTRVESRQNSVSKHF